MAPQRERERVRIESTRAPLCGVLSEASSRSSRLQSRGPATAEEAVATGGAKHKGRAPVTKGLPGLVDLRSGSGSQSPSSKPSVGPHWNAHNTSSNPPLPTPACGGHQIRYGATQPEQVARVKRRRMPSQPVAAAPSNPNVWFVHSSQRPS